MNFLDLPCLDYQREQISPDITSHHNVDFFYLYLLHHSSSFLWSLFSFLFSTFQMSVVKKRHHSEVSDADVDTSFVNENNEEAVDGVVLIEDSTSGVDMSNMLLSRIEEKSLMKNLTKRLDYYILRQREREASTHSLREELEQARLFARNDIAELRSLHEAQDAAAIAAQNELTVQMIQYKEQAERLTRDIAVLRADITKNNDARNRVEGATRSRSEELSNANKDILTLQARVERLTHEVETQSKNIVSLTNQLETSREEVKNERNLRLEAVSNMQNDTPNYQREISLLRDKIQQLNQEKLEWNKSMSEIKRDLNQEYVDNLNKTMKTQQARFEEEKDALVTDLRAAFKETELGLVSDIQNLENTKNRLEEEATISQRLIQDLRKNVIEATASRESLAKDNEALRTELSTQAAQFTRELAERNEISIRSEQRYLSKSREFNALMDVKVRLALEIKRYRELVMSAEFIEQENQLELELEDVDSTSRVVIISMDLESGEILFKNGTTEVVNLNKWCLYSKKTRKELLFPKVDIHPGQSFKVYFGQEAEQQAAEEESGEDNCKVFAAPGLFASSDTAILTDGRGKEVSRVEIN